MAAIDVTPASIRPLNGAITRRGNAGASLNAGDAVYLDGSNGWKKADGDDVAQAQARGIVVANGNGQTAYVQGERVDIVVFGPVEGFSGMTPGAVGYVSTTAGALDHTKSATTGDFNFILGWAESDTIFFVFPENAIPVAV